MGKLIWCSTTEEVERQNTWTRLLNIITTASIHVLYVAVETYALLMRILMCILMWILMCILMRIL
jgi:hypothetical protein